MSALNGTLSIRDTTMEYIRFGRGERALVMLPGLGDGLRTVKGTALPMSLMYRKLASQFTVYAFSRINDLPECYSTLDMARDQALAMRMLGIQRASVLGVSMGGMIAQHLAAEESALVDRLVLTVTAAEPHQTIQESVNEWISLAQQGNHAAFMDSNLKRMYTERYYRQNKWATPLSALLTKPKSYDRFFTQANACLSHNTVDRLPGIECPTLVIGGEKDRAISPDQSRKIAELIPHSTLRMYPDYGHALYEEAKDFEAAVLTFLTDCSACEEGSI